MQRKYPIWWEDTITVFNRYQDPTTKLITWYKTTISGCFWKRNDTVIKLGESLITGNDILCRIPKSESYLDRFEWEALEDKSSKFTLSIGDIVVKGEATSDIIDEYSSDHRSTDLIEKYKNVRGAFTIENFAINVGVGRVDEHYLIKGK